MNIEKLVEDYSEEMKNAIQQINTKLDNLNEDFFKNIVGTEMKKGVEELKEHID